jgi:hypothetical protein
MTTPDLVRTVEALANRRPVIAGLTAGVGRSAVVDAQQLIELEGAVEGRRPAAP